MEKIRELLFILSRTEQAWYFGSLLAMLASCLMLFFVPTITVFQIVIILVVALIVLMKGIFIFIEPDQWFDHCMMLGLSFVSLTLTVMWLFPISILWSIIPTALGITLFLLETESQFNLLLTIMLTVIFGVAYVFVNDSIRLKNYRATNPEPETVVVCNVDIKKGVMFIEGCEKSFSMAAYCDYDERAALNLKKGDTVKIITHPVFKEEIIEISK